MDDLVSFALGLAFGGADIIRPYFRAPVEVDYKRDNSPVTRADREAETWMRERIGERFPEHGIIGEEHGTTREDAEHLWVLDPIDGTRSFIAGVPLFGTLVALLRGTTPVIGVIHLPALGETLLGVEGRPTTFNGNPVRMRSSPSLERAILACTDHREAAGDPRRGKNFLGLVESVGTYRTWGDCYMYALLARGRADIAIDPVMNPWDIQALVPVIRGAGGVITDLEGNAPERGDSILAASPGLHSRVLALLNEPA
jgi:myo-inositol-1(or 4)-monophosphatase